jgi:hypothetical protein
VPNSSRAQGQGAGRLVSHDSGGITSSWCRRVGSCLSSIVNLLPGWSVTAWQAMQAWGPTCTPTVVLIEGKTTQSLLAGVAPIEPMIVLGSLDAVDLSDGWMVVPGTGPIAVRVEHTIVPFDDGRRDDHGRTTPAQHG